MTGRYTVGVDVGGTSTRVGLVDASGAVVRFAMTATPHGAVSVTGHLIGEIADIVGNDHHDVDAIAVGIPGRIDPVTGTVSMAVNLGIVEPLALGPTLSAEFGRPVTLGNDVDMAAAGVHRHLGGGDASLAYFSIGTGFAAGLVLNGRLHRGVGGAGEIGHLPVPGGTARCSCGQVGCAETLASGGAMLRAWGRPDADIESLWDAAESGDERAATIRAAAIATTAWVIQCAVLLLDVERIVLGGGVTRLGDRLLDPLVACLREREAMSPLLPTYAMTERVTLADQDVEYGVIGAAAIARAAATDAGPVTPDVTLETWHPDR